MQLIMYNQEQANLANEQNDEIYNQSRLIFIITTVITVVLSILVATYIINGITKSIKFIIGFIEKTSNLDLVFDQKGLNTINKYKDEFFYMGMEIAKMRKTLRDIIGTIKQNSFKYHLMLIIYQALLAKLLKQLKG